MAADIGVPRSRQGTDKVLLCHLGDGDVSFFVLGVEGLVASLIPEPLGFGDQKRGQRVCLVKQDHVNC